MSNVLIIFVVIFIVTYTGKCFTTERPVDAQAVLNDDICEILQNIEEDYDKQKGKIDAALEKLKTLELLNTQPEFEEEINSVRSQLKDRVTEKCWNFLQSYKQENSEDFKKCGEGQYYAGLYYSYRMASIYHGIEKRLTLALTETNKCVANAGGETLTPEEQFECLDRIETRALELQRWSQESFKIQVDDIEALVEDLIPAVGYCLALTRGEKVIAEWKVACPR